MYNLTHSQKELLQWFVKQVNQKQLSEEFMIGWTFSGPCISGYSGQEPLPEIKKGAIQALKAEGLLLSEDIGKNDLRCTLTGKAYKAVNTNFDAPDTSFVKHLTPLADITNLDEQLKQRCLPILSAASADPNTSWDTAVNNACRVLENRLRDVGGISDTNCVGLALVNNVFSNKGTLASKLPVDAERQGYRDLYAGIVGAFRNPSAHRFVDPTPEEGGAFIVFVNLLLKKLEDLR
jgi:hypothetical protein